MSTRTSADGTVRRGRRPLALLGAAMTGAAIIGFGGASPADAGVGAYPDATVHAQGGLNARSAPSVHGPVSYQYANGTQVSVDCVTQGTAIEGNRNWYLISAEGDAKWVSGRYLTVDGNAERCGLAVSKTATTNRPTGSWEGPSKDDLFYESLNKGVRTDVMCYTDAAATGQPQQRWMVAGDGAWIPAKALRVEGTVPYCSQS